MSQLYVPDDVEGVNSLKQEYKFREYERLCSEIEKQLDRLDKIDERVTQIAGFCATIAGVIVTVGGLINNVLVQLLGAAVSLFACPILLGFSACQREKIDLRIAQINYHLRYEHEEKAMQGEGWEQKRHELFKARPWFPKMCHFMHPDAVQAIYHELAPRRGLSVIASRGLFCTVELVFMLAGAGCAIMAWQHHPAIEIMVFVGLLFVVSLLALVLSWSVIEHKRHR